MRLIARLLTVALIMTYLPAHAQSGWVVIVSPTAGQALSGRNAEVSVSYNTGSSDRVTHIELVVDGKSYAVKNLAVPADRGIASFLLDTSRLGNGGHELIVKLFSGNKLVGSTSGDCTIGNRPVDVTPPTIKFVGVKNGAVISGTTAIRVSTKDDSGEEPLVSVFIDKSLKLVKNSSPYDYAWNTREYDEGRHTLTACAYDGAGNKGEAQAIELVIRNNKEQPAGPSSDLIPMTTIQPKASDSIKSTGSVIPVERNIEISSARSVEHPAKATMPAARPAASTESKPRLESVQPTIGQPIVIARAVEPAAKSVVPTERKSAGTASRTIERQPIATSPANVVDTSRPVVVASAPERDSLNSRLAVPKTRDLTEAQPIADPNATLPSRVTSHETAEIIAALPEDMASPASTATPSISDPVTTSVTIQAKGVKQRIHSADVSITLGQKLSKPELPAAKPIIMAMAPKQEPVKLPPSLEPRKMTAIVVQTVEYKRTMVTELRHAVASGGGGIVSWDHKTKTVLAAFKGKKVKLQVGKPVAVVGQKPTKISYVPYINEKGRTMVDVRVLKAVLGAKIELDKRNHEAKLITY